MRPNSWTGKRLILFSHNYGLDHPQTAGRLTALAESLPYQKKYDEAVAALEQALAIQERVY